LSLGSFAFGGTFGGPWSFQGDWHNTDTSMCKPGVTGSQTRDWYDFNNWGMQNNGNNGCAVTLFDNYIFLAVESKAPEPCVSTWNAAYPGTDANGYDLYATQVFVMPWAWEYAPAGFRMDIEAGNINCGRMIALAYNVPWPASWNAYPILDVNGGTVITPGYRNFDANFPYDANKFDDPCYPWVDPNQGGLWVGGGDPGAGENWGIVNIRNTGKMIMPRIRLMNGEINIFPDGLLYHNDPCTTYFFISQARSRNHINVAGGELRLKGDRLDQVTYYLSKGRLIPCDGHGDLSIDFNGTDTSITSVCTPDSAWNPNPIDGALSVPLNKTFSWSAGPSTQPPATNNAHTVYFGTDFAEVNDATSGGTDTDACSFNPGTLVMDTNYFWRVDENNNLSDPVGYWKGNVWAFKSKGPQASDPIPLNNAVGIPVPMLLRWSPGAKAQTSNGHRIFFGISEANVTDSTAGNILGGVTVAVVSSESYNLDTLGYTLAADTNYYWRVDEINDLDTNSPWKGETWHVESRNYYVVDDFELYTDNDTMLAKWDQGSTDYTSCAFQNANGVIDFDFNDGQGRMQYDYNDSISEHFSEVRLNVNNVNWNGGAALPSNNKFRSLAIGFQGNTTNDHDPDYDRMYVAVEDTAGRFGLVENTNPEAQRVFGWDQWYISLADLRNAGTPPVDINFIKYLYLGFGERCVGYVSAGGSGRIRVDDIRLYQQGCNPAFPSSTDLNGDCIVNLADLDVMANAWLASAIVISPVTNPGTTGLQLWYKFEETSGTVVNDSSGNNRKGDVNSYPTLYDAGIDDAVLWSPTGGFDGNGCFVSSAAVNKKSYTNIEANVAALSSSQTSVTFTIWIKMDAYQPLAGWPRVISVWQDMNAARTDENEVIEADTVARAGTGGMTLWRAGVVGDSNGTSLGGQPISAYSGGWHHYAFLRDGSTEVNSIRIYHNGAKVAEANALRPIFGSSTPYDGTLAVESFRLLCTNYDSRLNQTIFGNIDDFRVYNRALTNAEIGWLGTKGTGVVPFTNTSNLKVTSPDKVNFNDYAILMKDWLKTNLWPNP
jgi:hypothetical protein